MKKMFITALLAALVSITSGAQSNLKKIYDEEINPVEQIDNKSHCIINIFIFIHFIFPPDSSLLRQRQEFRSSVQNLFRQLWQLSEPDW